MNNTTATTMTRRQLEAAGAKLVRTKSYFQEGYFLLEGRKFVEKSVPGDSGAGWYQGRIYDMDCLVYEEVSS